ncbi:MAG: M48 family metalloprotease [Polyangiaceae bacterium]|nr:M48 family metalloprotease [Polyangiaceae bacterium]
MTVGRFVSRVSLLVAVVVASSGCSRQRKVQYPPQQPPGVQPYPNNPYPNNQYGPPPPAGQYGAPQPAMQQPGYGAPAPGSAPAPAPPAAALPAPAAAPATVTNDPINLVDRSYLRGRAGEVHQALIAALNATYAAKVSAVPLLFDDEVGSVNAFAACTDQGKAFVVVTDGLLEIAANLAQAKATDDIFGSRKLDEYIRFVAQNQRPKQPIVRPPQGFYVSSQQVDGRKVQRQHQVFDEEVAFVVGHELGHHYLNHLPCTAQGGLGAGELARVLSGTIPAFNQPNEVAADMAGTQNVLSAGSRQSGYKWTEQGGLVTMQFFAGLDQLSAETILFGFESSHPPPQLRMPIIQQTASTWRATGGQGLPFPFAL